MKKTLMLTSVLLLVLSGCANQTKRLFNGKDFKGWDFYLEDANADAAEVWTVRDGVVHCLGKPYGYMQTQDEYSDYKLHLEWRWVKEAGNSGVLLHKVGQDKLWPKSVECQLYSGNAGDFWLIDGVTLVVEGKRTPEKEGAFNVKKKQPSSEKPLGQWNSYDIISKDGAVRCLVNGVLQNEGTDASETRGKICLQSEGAPIEFRNVYLELPAGK